MSISSLVQLQELRRVEGNLFSLPTPPKLQPPIKIAGERSRGVLSIYPSPRHTQAPLPAPGLVGNSMLPRTKTCGSDSAHQDHPTPPGNMSGGYFVSKWTSLPSLSWSPLLGSRRKHSQKAAWRSLYAQKDDKASGGPGPAGEASGGWMHRSCPGITLD